MQSERKRRAAICRARFRRRSIKAMALLFAGVALECWMISMIFQVSSEDPSHENIVIASTEDNPQTDTPIALTGIVDGISALEDYSERTTMISLSDNKDDILAGAGGLDRRVIHRTDFQQAFANSSASQLEYMSEMTIISNQMSKEDFEALTRITEAETSGSDEMSKMMVAAVILNRVKDDRFPDTVCDVVFQESQFTPVEDGRYDSCTVSEETIEAIDRVLSGEDPSEGALYFVARDSADGSAVEWFDNELIWLFNYGGHDFYTY